MLIYATKKLAEENCRGDEGVRRVYANYVVDESGEEVPNARKMGWAVMTWQDWMVYDNQR